MALKQLTNEELVEALKKVVWKGGWDAIIKEIERRMKRLTRYETFLESLEEIEKK